MFSCCFAPCWSFRITAAQLPVFWGPPAPETWTTFLFQTFVKWVDLKEAEVSARLVVFCCRLQPQTEKGFLFLFVMKLIDWWRCSVCRGFNTLLSVIIHLFIRPFDILFLSGDVYVQLVLIVVFCLFWLFVSSLHRWRTKIIRRRWGASKYQKVAKSCYQLQNDHNCSPTVANYIPIIIN